MEKEIIDTKNSFSSKEGNLLKVMVSGLEHIGHVREIRVFKGEWGTIRLMRRCSNKNYLYIKEETEDNWKIINEIPEWVFKHSPYLKMEDDIDD